MMGLRWVDWPPEVLASLRTGVAIPAHPLALDEHRKLEWKMRKDVTDNTRNAAPFCACNQRRKPRRCVEIKFVRPFAAGDFAHSAE